jgi:hypothetical protein
MKQNNNFHYIWIFCNLAVILCVLAPDDGQLVTETCCGIGCFCKNKDFVMVYSKKFVSSQMA